MSLVVTSFLSIDALDVRLAVEPNHSTILFSVPISNGMTRVTGKFKEYTMDIEYDSIQFTNSKILVNIKAASIDTGIDGRDDHLRTADFFDTETYPEISFVSTSITEIDSTHFLLLGDFTMHGVSKQIEVPLVLNGKDGKYTLGFSARLSLNRTDYGVGSDFKHSSMENFIGDEIGVEIDFWTKKWKAPKTEEK
jgi:polyisoprenoid-binding protein YceI